MLENWYWFWYWIVSGESIGTGIGPKKVVLLISGPNQTWSIVGLGGSIAIAIVGRVTIEGQ